MLYLIFNSGPKLQVPDDKLEILIPFVMTEFVRANPKLTAKESREIQNLIAFAMLSNHRLSGKTLTLYKTGFNKDYILRDIKNIVKDYTDAYRKEVK